MKKIKLCLLAIIVLVLNVNANDPWPAKYKINPWDTESLTDADVVGPDGIVYPNWTIAGVEGGIPDISGWTKYNITNYSGTDDEKVDFAIADAVSAGQGVIYFPDSTYTLKSEHKVSSDSIVFLGESKTGTIIEIAEGGSGSNLFYFDGNGTSAYSNPTQTVERGSNTIVTDDVSGYTVGDWIRMVATTTESGDVMNDRYSRPEIGLEYTSANQIGRTYFARIIAIDAGTNTLTLDRPTHHDFYGDEDLQVRKCKFISNCGVQNMTIKTLSGDVAVEPVLFQETYNSWVKNVYIDKPKETPVSLKGVFHIELRDCDFDGSWAFPGASGYLGLSGWYGGDYNLMDNCTGKDYRHMPIFQWSNTSVVRNCTFTGNTTQSPLLDGDHPHDNLIELCEFNCEATVNKSYSTRSLGYGTEGPRGVLYNNKSNLGYIHISYVENHIIAYNTITNTFRDTIPAVWAHNKAWDAIIRGNSFNVSITEPMVELCDQTSVGWEIYDNKVYGSNGYAWEGDGQVEFNDNNRILTGSQADADEPEATSIYQWQKDHADDDRLLLIIHKGAISENGDTTTARLIRIVPGGDATSGSLNVSLSATNSDEVSIPSDVTISAGSNYVDFIITGVNDGSIDGEQVVSITASTSGFLSDSDEVSILDDESDDIYFAEDKPNRCAFGPKENWANGDFGITGLPGSSKYSNDTFTITGYGNEINTNRNLCYTGRQFCYARINGDGEIIAKLEGISGSYTNKSIGLMAIDDENALGDAYIVTASKGVYQWHREHDYWPTEEIAPESSNTTPIWLRIKRNGAVFYAYYSTQASKPSGAEWIMLDSLDFYQDITGSSKAVCAFDNIMYFGMFVNSNSLTDSATALFTNVELIGDVIECDVAIVEAGSNSPVCVNDTLKLTESGGDAVSWEWSGPNGFNSIEQNPFIPNVTFSDAGVYKVTIQDINNNMAVDSINVRIDSTTASEDVISVKENMQGFVIYPNPVQNILNVDGLENLQKVVIKGLTGNTIKHLYSPGVQYIDVSDLNSGAYIIICKTEKSTYRAMFLKE